MPIEHDSLLEPSGCWKVTPVAPPHCLFWMMDPPALQECVLWQVEPSGILKTQLTAVSNEVDTCMVSMEKWSSSVHEMDGLLLRSPVIHLSWKSRLDRTSRSPKELEQVKPEKELLP